MGLMFEAIIIVSIVSLIFWFFYNKKNRKYIYWALGISFIWVYFSGLYGYRESNYVILGLNLFAFSAWSAGLVLTKKIYDFFKFKKKYWLFVIVYMILIFTLEYVGYNIWNIKLTTNYTGIFGIEAMHMPWWGKLYYLTIGLIFVRLEDLVKAIKNMFEKKEIKKKTDKRRK